MSFTIERPPVFGSIGPPLCGNEDGGSGWRGPQCPDCPWLNRVLRAQIDYDKRQLQDLTPEAVIMAATRAEENVREPYQVKLEDTAGVRSTEVQAAIAAARREPCSGPTKERRFQIAIAGRRLTFGSMVMRCTNEVVPSGRFQNGYPGRWLLTGIISDDRAV